MSWSRDAQHASRAGRNLPDDTPVKVDVVAHSMGGLVLRYYLRYGTQPLPEDGSLPELTWAGAANVEHAILVGTPNAGSVLSFQQLVEGWNLGPLFPNYRASVLGTMPAIYQLLPRSRHARVIDETTGRPIDIFDPDEWIKRGWGLADPEQDFKLEQLLPTIGSAEHRRLIAIDHLTKSLARAEQLHRALDLPAAPPAGTRISLFAADSRPTPALVAVDAANRIRIAHETPGDGTVTRHSALMDERVGRGFTPGLLSPIAWNRVQFLFTDHLGLTRDAAFADNVLYLLLEDPRTWSTLP
jgi:pimeloyl-ACP methyl ester carboxylesterase